ncbi:6840_t:CDS:2, partial [Funneliformis geosporum]
MDLYQRLLTAHSEALLYMINDTVLMSDTIKIRIQQLQHKDLANDLRRYSLLFMEQLVNSDGNQMLTFFDHCIRSDIIPHSPKSPKWYDILQTALLKDNSSRDIVAHFQHI